MLIKNILFLPLLCLVIRAKTPSSPVSTEDATHGEKYSLKNLNTLPQQDIQHLSFDAFITFWPQVLQRLLKLDILNISPHNLCHSTVLPIRQMPFLLLYEHTQLPEPGFPVCPLRYTYIGKHFSLILYVAVVKIASITYISSCMLQSS